MNDEQAFLRAILVSPGDDGPRLVYADWLEEHGDDRRAEFLRLQIAFAAFQRERKAHPEARLRSRKRRLRARLRELRSTLAPEWLALVERPAVENCPRFAFRCPKQWEKLRETGDPFVRFCARCEQNVYYCRSVGEAQAHARQGHCVAVDPGVAREPGDLNVSSRRLLGVVALPPPRLTMGRMRSSSPHRRPRDQDGDDEPRGERDRRDRRREQIPSRRVRPPDEDGDDESGGETNRRDRRREQ